jgi:prevent-host-death family protein
MTIIDTNSLLSISEASQKGVSALIRAAEEGRDQVVLRNNKPVAAVVSMRRLDEEQQLREDLADVTMLAARMLTADGNVASLDDVLDRFGFTRDELRNIAD